MNGREPGSRYRLHFSERAGILGTPSSDLLKRRFESEQRRKSQTIGRAAIGGENWHLTFAPVDTEDTEARRTTEVVALPIERYRDTIIETVSNNRATIITSETGSGKTTEVPQFLLDAGYDHIYVGEPRRPTVDGPGSRVQSRLDERLGLEDAEGLVETIHGGRAIRYENSRISFATAASLIFMIPSIREQVENGEKIAICIDEIHEDDQYVEALTGVVGYFAHEFPSVRIICMSATVDTETLKVPLARITNLENPDKVTVPVIHVEGRPFTYTSHETPGLNPAESFLKHSPNTKISALVSKGYPQLKSMKQTVIEGYENREKGSSDKLVFREFSGKISTKNREEIARLAEQLDDNKQLVVLGTPAMRSGVTIPGLQDLHYDGMINLEKRREDRGRGIVTEYAAKSDILQFFGRAGRDVDGAQVYLNDPMPGIKSSSKFNQTFPFMPFNKRPDFAEPAIFNGNLSELLLLGASAGVPPEMFNRFIINEQSSRAIHEAVNRLHGEFGALDEDGKITEIGRLMGRFPVAPELARGLAEAMMNGRSKQQLARMAIIAAAIDTGGIQREGVSLESASWRRILGSGSTDDFIAQFDFWRSFRDGQLDGYASYDEYTHAVENDLDYGKFLGLDEPLQKTIRRLGLSPHDMSVDPPSFDEINEIRSDFTSGMYSLTYRESSKRRRDDDRYHFTPIIGADIYPERTLVTESVLEPRRGDVVAGMPTFRQKMTNDGLSEVELLTATLKVRHEDIGRYALAGGGVRFVGVSGSARIDGGMVSESFQGMFGTMKVGSHVSDKDLRHSGYIAQEEIPLESRKKLVEALQNKPGRELQELRKVAETLAEYRRTLPPEIISSYRYVDAPVDFTATHIQKLLENYAERTRDAQEIDRLIGEHVLNNGISVDLYYSAKAQEEMMRRSPEYIELGEGVEPLRILYTNGKPYATNVSKQQLAAISGPLYIDEGFSSRREVMHQVKKRGRGTRRISFGSN